MLNEIENSSELKVSNNVEGTLTIYVQEEILKGNIIQ